MKRRTNLDATLKSLRIISICLGFFVLLNFVYDLLYQLMDGKWLNPAQEVANGTVILLFLMVSTYSLIADIKIGLIKKNDVMAPIRFVFHSINMPSFFLVLFFVSSLKFFPIFAIPFWERVFFALIGFFVTLQDKNPENDKMILTREIFFCTPLPRKIRWWAPSLLDFRGNVVFCITGSFYIEQMFFFALLQLSREQRLEILGQIIGALLLMPIVSLLTLKFASMKVNNAKKRYFSHLAKTQIKSEA